MRKELITLPLVTLILAGCSNLAVPKKISVKTKADYNFTLLNVTDNDVMGETNLSDMLSVDNLNKQFDVSGIRPGAKLYDYNPNGNSKCQQYLLSLPIYQVPLDIGEYLEKIDLNANLGKLEFSKEINIPKINLDMPAVTIPTASLGESINKLLTMGNESDSEVKFSVIEVANAGAGKTVIDFESVAFSSGKLQFTAAGCTSVTMKHKDTIIGSATFTDSKAEINLAGKTIYKDDMTLEFVSGGVSSTAIPYLAVVSDDATPGKVTGLTLDKEAKDDKGNALIPSVPSFDIKMTVPSGAFQSCKIGEGTLDIDIKADGWTGVEFSLDSINLDGALKIIKTDFNKVGETFSADLDGKTIKTGDIAGKASLGIEIQNATLDLKKSVSAEVNFDLVSLASVKVKIDGFDSTISEEFELPSEMSSLVDSIEMNEIGLKGTYTNTLPTGNDINMKVNCSFLGLTESGNGHAVFEAEKTNETFDMLNSNHKIDFKDPANQKVNIDAKVLLPGATVENPDVVEISNIEFDTTYKVGMSVEPVLDWKLINVKSDVFNSGDIGDSMELPIDLISIFSNLTGDSNALDNVTLSGVEFYLYYEKPEIPLFDNLEIEGNIGMSLIEPASSTKIGKPGIILGKENGDKDVLESIPLPELNPDANNLVKVDVSKLPRSGFLSLSDFIEQNKAHTGKNLLIDYNLELNSSDSIIKINKTDFEGDSSTEIAINAIVVFPLELKMSGTEDNPVDSSIKGTKIDLLQVTGIESGNDIMSRTQPVDIGEIEDILDVIDSVELKFELQNFPLKYTEAGKNILICIDLKDGSDAQYVPITKGNIVLKTETVKHILKTVPYSPEISLFLPEGKINLERNPSMRVKVDFVIHTDGTIDLTDKLNLENGGNR